MNINFARCNDILKTLPISLYLGRDGLKAEMDENGQGSYYNPLEDRIVVSYPCVKDMLGHVKTMNALDGIDRGILYHEVSHAMLTPKYLKKEARTRLDADILNVFEDERIETILHDFYRGVNFKENVILLNNYHGEQPKDAFGAFYHTVRYRTGDADDLEEVNDIITTYWNMTASSSYPPSGFSDRILRLYHKIAKKWLEENEPEKLEQGAQDLQNESDDSSGSSGESSGSGSSSSPGESTSSKPTYDGLSSSEKNEVVRRILEQEGADETLVGVGEGIPIEEDGDAIDGESSGSQSSDGDMLGGNWHIPDYSDEVDAKSDIKKLIQKSHNATNYLDKSKVQKMLETMMNRYIDSQLTNEIAMIFENFTSRQKNNSAAIPRYSGIINPRAFARDDWRIFEYKSTSGPVKGYDKLHLNLFIDTSGSFYSNEDKTNTILKSLTTLEEKYPFFYFDLVTMQRTETLRTKKERYIQTGGGNDFDDYARDIYKQLQDPRSFNYNIVLFDGDAWTDCPRNKIEEHKKNMEIFNNSKCTIISDSDNMKPIEQYAPLSHHIFVSGSGGKSYASLLYDNLLAALTRALL